MALTKTNVGIPRGVWVNLYLKSGITVGIPVEIFNRGIDDILIVASVAAPTSNDIGVTLFAGNVGNCLYVSKGELGLWAYCSAGIGSVLVQN